MFIITCIIFFYHIFVFRYSWKLYSGDSPALLGPKFDHTLGTIKGTYALVEGSTGTLFSSAELDTVTLGATGPTCTMSFWYHMYGSQAGTLQVNILNKCLLFTHTCWKSKFTSIYFGIKLQIFDKLSCLFGI